MTPQKFFDTFIYLYQQARLPTFEDNSIHRGRCRAVSGGLEDLLAYFIAQNHRNKYSAYVDQYVNLGAKPVMYTDVLLLEKESGEVRHFIDAKTDLGFSSEDLEELSEHFKRQVERAKGVRLKLRGENGEEKEVPVSPNAECHIVIATRVNGRRLTVDRLRRIEEESQVNIFVLSDGRHPNSFSRDTRPEYPSQYINASEFERFHDKLR